MYPQHFPCCLMVGEILKVIVIPFDVVGSNDYFVVSSFSWIQAYLKENVHAFNAPLDAKLYCHPLGNALRNVVDGNNLSLKKKLNFVNYMRIKSKPTFINLSQSKNYSPTSQAYHGLSSTWLVLW